MQVPDESCAIPADRSAPYTGEGILDVRLVGDGAVTGYRAYPLLENALPAAEDTTVEPNRIMLREFLVDLSLPRDAGRALQIDQLFLGLEADDATRGFLHSRQPWSGSVEPAGGLTAAGVTVVLGELARRIRDQTGGELSQIGYVPLMATIQAVGETANATLVSDPFHYPIKVCDGCLIANLGLCPYSVELANRGHACNVAQDAPVDCCLSGEQLVCPAVVASE